MTNKKIASINTDLKGLMKYWLQFTKPFHSLKPQEIDILALLLYYYFIFKKDINNEEVIWKMVFDYDTKMKIKEELNDLPDYTLQNLLSRLRKRKVINNNKINQAYIPSLEQDSNNFKLIYNFNIINND